MLIQMLVHQPQMLEPVLKHTPTWVWALLAALIALGLSQARDRSASLARIAIMPVAMTALSVWGTVSAFGNSPQFGSVMLAWSAMAAGDAGRHRAVRAAGRHRATTRPRAASTCRAAGFRCC